MLCNATTSALHLYLIQDLENNFAFKNKCPQVWNGAYVEVQTREKFSAVWI